MIMKLTPSESYRFWSKVDIVTTETCWEWTNCCCHSGYGQFWLQGKTASAHRISYLLMKGEIPLNMCVLHMCDNPRCCNPSHLIVGTALDNSNDKCRKQRQARGSRNGRSTLSEQQALYIYKSSKSQKQLASQLGVSKSVVRRIKKGIHWSWLTGGIAQ